MFDHDGPTFTFDPNAYEVRVSIPNDGWPYDVDGLVTLAARWATDCQGLPEAFRVTGCIGQSQNESTDRVLVAIIALIDTGCSGPRQHRTWREGAAAREARATATRQSVSEAGVAVVELPYTDIEPLSVWGAVNRHVERVTEDGGYLSPFV